MFHIRKTKLPTKAGEIIYLIKIKYFILTVELSRLPCIEIYSERINIYYCKAKNRLDFRRKKKCF